MKSVTDIFSALGGSTAVARALGVPPSTASEMKRRNSIPTRYWRDLLATAERVGVRDLDAETLAWIHTRPKLGHGQPKLGLGTEAPAERSDPSASAGHFSKFYGARRSHFASSEEIRNHVSALRTEWTRR